MSLEKEAWAYARQQYGSLSEALQEDAKDDWKQGAESAYMKMLCMVSELSVSMLTREVLRDRIRRFMK